MSKWIAFRTIQIVFPFWSALLTGSYKQRPNRNLTARVKGSLEDIQNCNNWFSLPLIYIAVSHCSLSFLMLLFSLCRWPFWFLSVTFPLLFLGEQKILLKETGGFERGSQSQIIFSYHSSCTKHSCCWDEEATDVQYWIPFQYCSSECRRAVQESSL